jgi:hypothetical protein
LNFKKLNLNSFNLIKLKLNSKKMTLKLLIVLFILEIKIKNTIHLKNESSFSSLSSNLNHNNWDGRTNGTTENIREIFLGRCYYFLNILNRDHPFINNFNYDCPIIWQIFKNANIGKNPLKIDIRDYENFLVSVDQFIPTNKSLFWSETVTVPLKCNFLLFFMLIEI